MTIGNFIIYGLFDPRNGQLRYIGQSTSGLKRPKLIHAAHCKCWEVSLKNAGLEKEIYVIESWDGVGDPIKWLDDTEIFWIAYFKFIGADLTNLTSGGGGHKNPSQHTRLMLSLKKRGNKNPMFGKPGTMLGKKGEKHPVFGKKLKGKHYEESRNRCLYFNSLKQKQVINTNTNIIYVSISNASKELNISSYFVTKICNNNCYLRWKNE